MTSGVANLMTNGERTLTETAESTKRKDPRRARDLKLREDSDVAMLVAGEGLSGWLELRDGANGPNIAELRANVAELSLTPPAKKGKSAFTKDWGDGNMPT